MPCRSPRSFCFFFNDTATTEIYTLSLHDALPILRWLPDDGRADRRSRTRGVQGGRSEEHTSELQSLTNLVCRLLLEKKKQQRYGSGGRIKKENERFNSVDDLGD